jgi:hypothetical protein
VKRRHLVPALLVAAIASATTALAQPPRQDVIWARVASGPITLDGNFNEPSWALAESMTVIYRTDSGIPGSGWKNEQGIDPPTDPSRTTLKFLVVGNELYMAATVRDSSVGGSKNFNRHDGLLMCIKDHSDPNFPKPPAEYFYSWWYPSLNDPQPPGQLPSFQGKWATYPPGTPRTPEQIANWDAATVVQGLSNSDATLDQGYRVEMRFNLTPMGYNVTQAAGDVVEWNVSVYDCDWNWPIIPKFSANRVWWQGPWGNDAWYNEVRIYSRPSVTVSSGPVPAVGPDLELFELTHATPTLDGRLLETLWNNPLVYKFDIKYGDIALRNTYPATGKYRSGQYQPAVNGGTAAVLNPGDATVRMFVQGDFLYMGFDVRDQVVQYAANVDRWDGFIVSINEYSQRGPDQQLFGRRLAFQVGGTGTTGFAIAQDDLAHMVAVDSAMVVLALKNATTVDTFGTSADQGYTAELRVNLRGLGYPVDYGDGRLFLGVDLLDGDSYTPYTLSYGTRTWWFREYQGSCCPISMWLRPNTSVGVEPAEPGTSPEYRLLGNFPNPARSQRIQYMLPEPSRVKLDVYDVAGRQVEHQFVGTQGPGIAETMVDGAGWGHGLYFYRLTILDPETGAVRTSLTGRMILLR